MQLPPEHPLEPSKFVSSGTPTGEPASDFEPWPTLERVRDLASRFEEIVARHPHRPAVVGPSTTLTYAGLNQAANRLAHALKAATTDAHHPVGLILDHDVPLVVAILAVLKAGHIVVPSAPRHPVERHAALLRQAGCRILVTDAPNSELAGSVAGADFAILRSDLLPDGLPDRDPDLVRAPGDPAFVLYTSGSTGRPRGVIHTHATVLRNVRSETIRLGLRCHDRLSLVASCTTGHGMVMLFRGLLNGACLVLRDLAQEGIDGLGPWLLRERITVLGVAASVFRHFAAALGPADSFPDLRLVRLGAEQIHPGDIAAWRSRFAPPCGLALSYSSTETGVVALARYDHESPLPAGVVPLGAPTEGVEILVLDDSGRETGLGIPGHVTIRGRYLAPGYWLDPDSTAREFTGPDDAGRRCFATGDIGSRRADGSIVLVGRRDAQVKIRGFRVEPGEIEAALQEHPSVAACGVVARESAAGEQELAAYVVRRPQANPTVFELQTWLARRLPPQAIPSRFFELSQLPATPLGKLDRGALTGMPADPLPLGSPCLEPRTHLEAAIHACWTELLGRNDFGITENFFHLGGNSLLAVRLVRRLAEVRPSPGSATADLTLVLRAPTIAEQSRALTCPEDDRPRPLIVPLQPAGRRAPLFFVNGSLELWQLAHRLGTDQPSFGLRLPYDTEALVARQHGKRFHSPSLEELADNHLRLLVDRWPTGPYTLAGFCNGGVIAFELARRLEARGERVPLVILFDTPFPGITPDWRDRIDVWKGRTQRVLSESPSAWVRRMRRWHAERRRVRRLVGFADSNPVEDDDRTAHGLLIHLNRTILGKAARQFRGSRLAAAGLLVRAVDPAIRRADRAFADRRARPWGQSLFSGGFEMVEVTAAHHLMFVPPGVSEVADAILGRLSPSGPTRAHRPS